MPRSAISLAPVHKPLLVASSVAAAALAVAACSSSSKTAAAHSTASTAAPSQPGTAFSTTEVSGLGTVVVDGRGKTVYILTSGGHTNLPCSDATGCTKVWPDLPLPDGVATATAGSGLQASLLGTMKLSDGATNPTYNGWLMHEYAGDSGPGHASGQGIKSFGGTWYALSPSGNPITSTSSSSGSRGYGY